MDEMTIAFDWTARGLHWRDPDGQRRSHLVDGRRLSVTGGVYVVFTYDRSIRFRCNNIRGDNAVINAVFFQ